MSLVAAVPQALAGSVAQPGSTLGLAVGTPRPEGIYFENTSSYGERDAASNGVDVNLTQLVWATPVYIYDTRLSFFVMQPTVYRTNVATDTFYTNSTLFAARLAHAVTKEIGVSYQAGFRAAQSSPLSFRRNSLDQRAAISYNTAEWNLTANLLNGVFFQDSADSLYPNWINLDLTAAKKFGKLELGAVAFGSSDLSSPNPTYKRQSQIALGGFADYNFGAFTLQAFVTRDVAQSNHPGYDTRGWTRLIVPLYRPDTTPAPIRARS